MVDSLGQMNIDNNEHLIVTKNNVRYRIGYKEA